MYMYIHIHTYVCVYEDNEVKKKQINGNDKMVSTVLSFKIST